MKTVLLNIGLNIGAPVLDRTGTLNGSFGDLSGTQLDPATVRHAMRAIFRNSGLITATSVVQGDGEEVMLVRMCWGASDSHLRYCLKMLCDSLGQRALPYATCKTIATDTFSHFHGEMVLHSTFPPPSGSQWSKFDHKYFLI